MKALENYYKSGASSGTQETPVPLVLRQQQSHGVQPPLSDLHEVLKQELKKKLIQKSEM